MLSSLPVAHPLGHRHLLLVAFFNLQHQGCEQQALRHIRPLRRLRQAQAQAGFRGLQWTPSCRPLLPIQGCVSTNPSRQRGQALCPSHQLQGQCPPRQVRRCLSREVLQALHRGSHGRLSTASDQQARQLALHLQLQDCPACGPQALQEGRRQRLRHQTFLALLHERQVVHHPRLHRPGSMADRRQEHRGGHRPQLHRPLAGLLAVDTRQSLRGGQHRRRQGMATSQARQELQVCP